MRALLRAGAPALLCGALAVVELSPTAAASRSSGGAFRKGPYLQNVTRHSITVMWQSAEPMPGVVHLFGAHARSLSAEAAEMHEVVIDKLQPGRRYRYAVDCGGAHVTGEFATAPRPEAPFSFIVFGDTRSNAAPHRRLVERVRREIPDFVLETGDMVNDGMSEHDWQQFFDIERPLLRENVLYPSLGNHDRQGRGRTADNFRKFFSLPENSPDPERYYAFTYGNARFLVLDSNAYSFALTDQTAWIERQLEQARLDPSIVHIFVSMHHPPFSISLHGGQTDLRDAWTPLFTRYGVDAVFSGHDHVYSRALWNGVHYFVSGGGGASLYPRSRHPSKIDVEATKYFERVHHYLRVNVIGAYVEVSAIRSDGSLIETVSWGAAPKADTAAMARLEARDRAADPAADGARARISAVGSGEDADGGAGTRAGGFGWLGKLGAALMLAAAAGLVWSLRR